MTCNLLRGGRDELLELFVELDEELRAVDVNVDVLMVGGSWLLWYRSLRATRDVDSALRIPRSAEAAICRVGDRHDLDRDWVNDRASAFLPHDFEASECDIVFDGDRLSVLAPTADTIFLMKLQRANPVDRSDMRVLWPLCSFASPADAADRFAAAYPHAPDDPHLPEFISRIAADAL